MPQEGFAAWAQVHLHPYTLDQAELAALLTRLQQSMGSKGELLPPALTAAEGGSGRRKAAGSSGRRTTKGTRKGTEPSWGHCVLHLPSYLDIHGQTSQPNSQTNQDAIHPIHSAYGGSEDSEDESDLPAVKVLHPWQLQGWWLSASEVLPLLLALPLGQG